MPALTKGQIVEWRERGYTYEEMARKGGVCVSTIGRYMDRYGLKGRRTVTGADRDRFRGMAEEGLGCHEIADQTGYAYSTVYKALKAEGLIRKRGGGTPLETAEGEEMPELPQYTMAVSGKRPPFPVEICGKRYQDVTYTYFPL